MYKFRWLAAMFIALAALPGAAAAQQGVVSGRVTAAETGQGLRAATVQVQGTELRTITDAQGNYRFGSVPPGTYTVSANQLGREPGTQSVTVAAGGTATANFALGAGTIAIEGLVATATGQEQRSREVGSNVGTINVEDNVNLAANQEVSQVLQGRVPGVTAVQAGGTVGTGARIRIRGANSVSLGNEPLLVIDGVRIQNGNGSSVAVGGQTPNRLNDINPQDIESIDILKGPAASGLYGTQAANGVIVINTKKGRPGQTRWNAYVEQGATYDPNQYPANYRGFCTIPGFGRNGSDLVVSRCDNDIRGRFSDAGIRLDSIQSFNPLETDSTSPFRTGQLQTYGLSVTGGSDQVTYYLSGEFQDNQGALETNFEKKKNLRANFRSQLSQDLDVTVNTGYLRSDLRLPQNDNNILGYFGSAFLGGPTPATGYGFFTPEEIAFINTKQNIERITGSANANFRPLSWLSFNSTVGLDVVNRFDNETLPAQRVFFGSLGEGERTAARNQLSTYTANINATANYKVPVQAQVTGTTSAGFQYNQNLFRGNFAFGRGLLAGTSTLNGTATGFAVDESFSDERLAGVYVQQQFGLNDRLFVTGSVRGDNSSAFGENFGTVYYPSVSTSWVVSEEPFLRDRVSFLDQLRLRASYGQSGLRPGQLDAIRYLAPTPVTVAGQSVPGFTIGGVGNRDLQPERTREYELGFDLNTFQNRLGFEFTYYNKRSSDALIARPLAPSLGVSTSQFVNIGEVKNAGLEGLLNAQLVDRPRFKWDLTLTGSTLDNELVQLGVDPTTGEQIQPIIFGLGGNTQNHREGFPLGGYFQAPILGFQDQNNDGLIDRTEVQIGDKEVFLGSILPRREASVQTNVTFFDVLKISTLFDYKGDYKLFNATNEFRCASRRNCPEIFGIGTSFEKQAAFIADRYFGSAAGYIEDASFLKWRELSATITLPDRFARSLFRAQGLSLTLAGRNLSTWTDYSGVDPEINFAGSGANFITADFLSQPPVRTLNARVDLRF